MTQFRGYILLCSEGKSFKKKKDGNQYQPFLSSKRVILPREDLKTKSKHEKKSFRRKRERKEVCPIKFAVGFSGKYRACVNIINAK